MSEGKCEFPEDWVREADPKLYNEVSAALQSQVSNGPINLIASYCIEKRSYITCSPAHIDVFPRRHFQHKIADGSINYDSCFHGSADRGFASPLAYYRGLYRYCVLADLDKVNVSEVLMRVDHMQWMSQSPAFVSSDHRLYLVMTEHLDEPDALTRCFLTNIHGTGTAVIRVPQLPYAPLPGERLELWCLLPQWKGRRTMEGIYLSAEVVLVHASDSSGVNAAAQKDITGTKEAVEEAEKQEKKEVWLTYSSPYAKVCWGRCSPIAKPDFLITFPRIPLVYNDNIEDDDDDDSDIYANGNKYGTLKGLNTTTNEATFTCSSIMAPPFSNNVYCKCSRTSEPHTAIIHVEKQSWAWVEEVAKKIVGNRHVHYYTTGAKDDEDAVAEFAA